MPKPTVQRPQPPVVNVFVSAGATPGSTPTPTPVSRPAHGRKTTKRTDGTEVRKQTIYLEANLSRRLAVYCAEQGQDLSSAIAEAIELLLSSNK